jgi:tetratricopeptide (TPR) repeat protein
MRTKNLALPIGALLTIAGCAGNSPKPQAEGAMKPDELVTYTGGSITTDDWDSWKKTSQMPAAASRDEAARLFGEYLKFRIDSLAARDAGITKDTALVQRWLSVRKRIVAERYRADVLDAQFGIDDTAISKHLAAHPELSALPADSARLKAARTLALAKVNIDSAYTVRKDSYRRDTVQLPLDSIRTQLENDVLREMVETRTRDFPDMGRKLYKVESVVPQRPEPTDAALKAVYDAQAATRYAAPAIFHMKALGSKDSAKLAKAIAKVKDVSEFQALASKFPVGSPVRAPKGDLGRVKRQFALPYGIGLVPTLFNELEPTRTGLVQPQLVGDSIWVAFWVSAVDSGSIKSFESVKAEVREEYLSSNPWTPPATAVLAKWDRGTLVTQADLDVIYQEIPQHMRRQYPPQRVVDFMTLWDVVARASMESGHGSRPTVVKAIADNERIFWSQEWRKSKGYQTFGLPTAATDSKLSAWKSLFANGAWIDSAGGINRDGARLHVMPRNYLQSRFSEDVDRYRKDTVFASFDSVKADLFRDVRQDLDLVGHAYQDSLLRVKFNVRTSPAAPGFGAKDPASVRLDSARALHDRRSLEDAQRLYESVESDAGSPDSLRAQALFQLGQLFGEQQNFPRSLSRYRAVLSRFPASGEAYKARFMIAFTYSEYLKEEKVALKEYRKVIADYPKCDLADDADWMIRNIESGGALMPKFDDVDSAAPAVVPAESAAPAEPAPAKATEAPKAKKATAPKATGAVKK